jgi:hypothetical protein
MGILISVTLKIVRGANRCFVGRAIGRSGFEICTQGYGKYQSQIHYALRQRRSFKEIADEADRIQKSVE